MYASPSTPPHPFSRMLFFLSRHVNSRRRFHSNTEELPRFQAHEYLLTNNARFFSFSSSQSSHYVGRQFGCKMSRVIKVELIDHASIKIMELSTTSSANIVTKKVFPMINSGEGAPSQQYSSSPSSSRKHRVALPYTALAAIIICEGCCWTALLTAGFALTCVSPSGYCPDDPVDTSLISPRSIKDDSPERNS